MEAITSTLNQEGDPSAALVSIEAKTGYIRAMVGGSDYDSSKFNLAAQGRRQPGSAFKTFCLVATLERGIDPYDTYYESMPVTLDYPGAPAPWEVKTYGNNYYGTSSVVQATLRSDNTVYAQMALDVGAEQIVDVAQRMGITSNLNPNPAIVLGGLTIGVSPLEMASAYATLANGGEYIQPTIILRIRDSSGNVIWEAQPKRTKAISAAVAYETTRILEMNIERGTGTRADIDRPAAGKTGTAQEWYDAWFCGYTHLSTAVWIGNKDTQISMDNVHGIRVTGGSFRRRSAKFMYDADRDYPRRISRASHSYLVRSLLQELLCSAPTTSTISTTTTTIPTTDTTDTDLDPPMTDSTFRTTDTTFAPPSTSPPTSGTPPATSF